MNEYEEFADSLPDASSRQREALIRMKNDDVSDAERNAIRLVLIAFPAMVRERMEFAEARIRAEITKERQDKARAAPIVVAETSQTKYTGSILVEDESGKRIRKLLKSSNFTADIFNEIELLLEDMRPESPLRHQLSLEFERARENWVNK